MSCLEPRNYSILESQPSRPDSPNSDSSDRQNRERDHAEGWRARPDDHLVEPMFSGLGIGDEKADLEQKEADSGGFFAIKRSFLWLLLLALLLSIVGWLLSATG
ncbi:MAG: hypothetical protein ACI8TQ_000983 [Planctomycetota bacterium]|jgi:hypothetical protein